MSKRFTDTEKWDQLWLKKLDPKYKLVWTVLESVVDHAGIWKIDVTTLLEKTGYESINVYDFIEACNVDYDKFTGAQIERERLKIVDEKYLWMTGFIEFQYAKKDGTLPENAVVKSALDILKGHSLLIEAQSKGFITLKDPCERVKEGSERDKDKDKDKDKEIDRSENNKGKTEKYSPTPSEIETVYQAYPRKVGKKAALKKIRKSLLSLKNQHGKEDPFGWLLDKVQEFAVSDKGNNGEFTPHPSTWFNQGRYFDDPKEWQNQKQSHNGANQPTKGDKHVDYLTS